ncbi:uncharacterized protein [Paramisgurnus dabryanus]|uniref:uncharacterized protein isoform X1 n=2 Tax=Paramisgurnus dabryanus TaxID=90735 RepID=UPI0031F3772F
MKKSLAILALAVLLLNGVRSVRIKDEDLEMADKLFVLGGTAFVKHLGYIQKGAEFALSRKNFNVSGNEMQNLWKSWKELMDRTIAEERDRGNQDDFFIAARLVNKICTIYTEGVYDVIMGVAESTFEDLGPFGWIFNNETLVELWRDVGSQYFPEAPPFYSDPFGSLSYIFSKIVLTPNMVRNLKVALEVVKIDFDQLYKDAQVAFNLVKEKAMEISALERQTEKNDFAVTLRTASAVLVFYWDKFLEYTESKQFHDQYIDSLRMLKDTSKNCYAETEEQVLSWSDQNFGNLLNNVEQEYYRWGDKIFGNERFNQSNWAFYKIASVYRIPIHEKLCESRLKISEVNKVLGTVYNVLTDLGGEEIMTKSRKILHEIWNHFDDAFLSKTKKNEIPDVEDTKNPKQPLHTIKEIFFDIWDQVIDIKTMKENDVQESLRQWDEVKNIFIKELIDSGKITQKDLDEAQKTLMNVKQMVFEKYVKTIDGLDKRIDSSAEFLGDVMLLIFTATHAALISADSFSPLPMLDNVVQWYLSY